MKIKNSNLKCKTILFYILFFWSFSFLESYALEKSIYTLTSNQLEYFDNSNTVIATGNAKAIDQFGKEVFADEIIYNKKNSKITTKGNSIYKDKKGNLIYADIFDYDLNSKIIQAFGSVKYLDKRSNEFNFTKFKYLENEEIGTGENLRGILFDKSRIDSEVAEINNIKKMIFLKEKNHYTTCVLKNDDKKTKSVKNSCPDWSFVSGKTIHDGNEKMLYHYDSVIKLWDIPVFYTPYFSHPDPSVKRKSGFLPPSTKNFSDTLGRTVKTPYFWNISDSQDLTISPIYYFDEKPLLMAEYRQQNKNSFFYIDSSFTEGYKDLNKTGRTGGSRNHFFMNFLGTYEDILFKKNDIEINIERLSQKNYLKVNEINTKYVDQGVSNLSNFFKVDSYGYNKHLSIKTTVYENKNADDTEKYSYEIPAIIYQDSIQKYNQTINISNNFLAKNFNGNSKQSTLLNEINTTSNMNIVDQIGLGTVFKTNISNINLYNENISANKENLNVDNFFTFGIENSIPLLKYRNSNTEEILTPRVFSKFTSGSMLDSSDSSKTLSYGDIYSMNRMNNTTNPETGGSIGYGIEYEINFKNQENRVFNKNNFYAGQVWRGKVLNEMPLTSSLDQKQSDFVGGFDIFYSKSLYNNEDNKILGGDLGLEAREDGLKASYEFTLTNDLNKILKNNLKISYNNNKNEFVSTYNEAHDYVGNYHSISGKYKRYLPNDFNVALGATKNIQDSFTENNFLELNYDSDCLRVSFNLSKQFYNNSDVKPSNNLSFSIMLKPFGQPISPDLNSFFTR